MTDFELLGHDIREAFANHPERPLPGYSLPPGNVTMDSSLCRPWRYGSATRSAVPFPQWRDAVHAYHDIPRTEREAWAVYRYRVEAGAGAALNGIVERPRSSGDEAPGNVLHPCGFDVVIYDRDYAHWMSFVANDGIPFEILSGYGALTPFGLFETAQAAHAFRESLDEPDRPEDAAVVVSVERATPDR